MPAKAPDSVWTQLNKAKRVAVKKKKKKSEGVGKLKDTFNIKLEDAEFRIESAGFWSCFGSVVPHYFSFPPIWSEK